MRVVLINRYFHPDESATSRMVSSLAFGLAGKGVEVEIVTSRYRHDDPVEAMPRFETIKGVGVHRIAASYFGRAGLAGRAADYASFHASASFWCLAHIRHGDIVIPCTDPPLLSVSLEPAIAARGGLLVNWLHDIFPEIAIELGMIGRGGTAARLALAARDRALQRASQNVVPTAAMALGLLERGITRGTMGVIPYWSEENEIRPIAPELNPLRSEWNLTGRFVVGYSGNFGRAHEFETLLDAAEHLRDHEPIRFLLIGGGFGRQTIENEIGRRGLTNVILRPLQPRERLAESLSAADVHLISLRSALEPYVVPSKLYGIMAAGRPILFIGADDGEVATTLRSGNFGQTVAIGQGRALAAKIVEWQLDPALCEAMGRRARIAFENGHLRARGITEWLELLKALKAQQAFRPSIRRGLFGRLG
ncbi:glycosyltransferase family 4 protein [Kaistia terrae]|uniref:Glycosyltransferase family 4 protein n=1 Tax=Kaistia terrae TaxID=537017 RepID=A0ABW0Q1A1_9HYPH|nr:glycosyltransferase family 4 protein [Kaistia terrae]MCX5578594.1 glycosyltransferase family 4 protein [Kaistia terrae]